MKDPARQPVIVGCGVVSPFGVGNVMLLDALRGAKCSVAYRSFEGLGDIPVASCNEVKSEEGVDRTETFAQLCLDEISELSSRVCDSVSSDRRGVAFATSKGAFLRMEKDLSAAQEDILSILPNAIAVSLARRLSISGPSTALVSACATGLNNICRAAEWIEEGVADAVWAGSSEATLSPMYLGSFLNLKAMSRTGSFPYDEKHDGFIAGEGSALFLLTSRKVAEQSGLEIKALISGGAYLSEAYHSTAMNLNGEQVRRLVKTSLRYAGLSIEDIDVFCSHGTSTQQNDLAEANGMKLLSGSVKEQPPLFALKGAMGHLMGGAGSVELAACLLALEHQFVPGVVGYTEPAPGCEGLNISALPRQTEVKRLLKWNLGFGGHLAACVLTRG